MHYNFCPTCGKALSGRPAGDDGLVPFCVDCGKYWFDSFSTCVIILVANEYNEVTLLRQGYLSDKYASFVSGYMSPGESAEEAAVREVREELGLDIELPEFAGTYWFPAKELLMVGFIGFSKKCGMTLSEEVDSAAWVPAQDVPKYLFPKAPGNAAYAIYEKFMEKKRLSTAV